MKKYILIFVMLYIFVAAVTFAFAAPVSTTGENLERNDFKVEGESDFVFKRYMDYTDLSILIRDNANNRITQGPTITFNDYFDQPSVEMNRHFVNIYYGVLDNVDIFGKIGIANPSKQENYWLNGSVNERHWAYGDTDLVYGGGGRLKIFEYNGFGLNVGGQYNYYSSEFDEHYTAEALNLTLSQEVWELRRANVDRVDYITDMDIHEWQASISANYDYEMFDNFNVNGYMGCKYSDLRLYTDEISRGYDGNGALVREFIIKNDTKASINWGIFFGSSLIIITSFLQLLKLD